MREPRFFKRGAGDSLSLGLAISCALFSMKSDDARYWVPLVLIAALLFMAATAKWFVEDDE
jgi:hypothetical protein